MSTIGTFSTAGASLPAGASGVMARVAPVSANALSPKLSPALHPRRILSLLRSACTPGARPARIAAMLIAIIAMSLADLYMTLAHLLHFGMIEANPIARRIMQSGSPAELITWKLTSILVTVSILFVFRRRAAAELGALAGLLAMAWLTAHWFNYNDGIAALTQDMHELAAVNADGFVSMIPGGQGE